MTRTVRLDPMTEAEYEAWWPLSMRGYAQANIDAGHWSPQEATDRSVRAMHNLLPDGYLTPGQELYTVRDAESGEAVGTLWLSTRERLGGRELFVFDIMIADGLRGRGYGRATMEAAAARGRELGLPSVGLNVFGYNTPAVELYKSLGYQAANMNMRLEL